MSDTFLNPRSAFQGWSRLSLVQKTKLKLGVVNRLTTGVASIQRGLHQLLKKFPCFFIFLCIKI